MLLTPMVAYEQNLRWLGHGQLELGDMPSVALADNVRSCWQEKLELSR